MRRGQQRGGSLPPEPCETQQQQQLKQPEGRQHAQGKGSWAPRTRGQEGGSPECCSEQQWWWPGELTGACTRAGKWCHSVSELLASARHVDQSLLNRAWACLQVMSFPPMLSNLFASEPVYFFTCFAVFPPTSSPCIHRLAPDTWLCPLDLQAVCAAVNAAMPGRLRVVQAQQAGDGEGWRCREKHRVHSTSHSCLN